VYAVCCLMHQHFRLLKMIRTSGMLAQVCTVLCCARMLECAQLSVLELCDDYGLAWPLSYFNNDSDTARSVGGCDMMLHVA